MKCIHLVTAMGLAMFAASPAWALPESAEMHVSGAVTAASSCSLSISNGGAIDLGQIDIGSLNQSSSTNVGAFARTVSVTCDSPTRFALGVIDNRADTLNSARLSCGHCMAMGWTTSQRPIGFYGLAFYDDAIVDGVSRTLLLSNDLATWEVNFGLFLTPQAKVPSSNGRHFVAAAEPSTTLVIAATTMSIQFYADVFLESRETMAITQQTPIDGNSTLEIIYL